MTPSLFQGPYNSSPNVLDQEDGHLAAGAGVVGAVFSMPATACNALAREPLGSGTAVPAKEVGLSLKAVLYPQPFWMPCVASG
jgi:hypothetical protein